MGGGPNPDTFDVLFEPQSLSWALSYGVPEITAGMLDPAPRYDWISGMRVGPGPAG